MFATDSANSSADSKNLPVFEAILSNKVFDYLFVEFKNIRENQQKLARLRLPGKFFLRVAESAYNG